MQLSNHVPTSQKCVIIGFRHYATGEIAFTKISTVHHLPSDIDVVRKPLSKIAAFIYGFACRFSDVVSQKLIFNNSSLIHVGRVHVKLCSGDKLGENVNLLFFSNHFSKPQLDTLMIKTKVLLYFCLHVSSMIDKQIMQQRMHKQDILMIWIHSNCRTEEKNQTFMEIVQETDKIENTFNVKIMHGIGLDIPRFVLETDRMSLERFLRDYARGTTPQPWENIVFGLSENIVEYLKYLIEKMDCWSGDDKGIDLTHYATPFRITTILKGNNVSSGWEYDILSKKAKDIRWKNEKLFECWQNASYSRSPHLVMTKCFTPNNFTADQVIQSASAMLMCSVCSLL